MKKRISLLLFAFAVMMFSYSPSFGQPTCSGAGCQGQDPVLTQCSQDGQWLTATPLNINGQNAGYVQLMYSPTCGTVWSRISTVDQILTPPTNFTTTTFFPTLKFALGLSFGHNSGTPYPATYDFTQVIDPSRNYHRDSLMLHVSDNRFINQGVKAFGTVGTVFVNKFTPPGAIWIKPSDLP